MFRRLAIALGLAVDVEAAEDVAWFIRVLRNNGRLRQPEIDQLQALLQQAGLPIEV